MKHALRTYRPSGQFGLSTILLALLAVIPGALLAFVYAWLARWIPFVYLNALVLLGFALALTLLAIKVVRLGRCRNRIVAGLVGLLIASGSLAASYVWDYQRALSHTTAANPGWTAQEIRREYTLARHLQARREAGWKVKGAEWNGIGVLLVWGVEALVTLGALVLFAAHSVDEPYCERCGCWTRDRIVEVPGLTGAMAAPLIERADLDALVDLQPPPDAYQGDRLAFTVSLCPACSECGFLSVTEKSTVFEKDKPRERRRLLLMYAVLEPRQRSRLESRRPPPPSAQAQSRPG